jgi:hypothetical protein
VRHSRRSLTYRKPLANARGYDPSRDGHGAVVFAVFYTAEGQAPVDARTAPRAYYHHVSPDFFVTLRTPFLHGRTFTEEEMRQNANVAVVTENLVQRFWPNQDPIDKRIKEGGADSSRP